MRTVGLKILKNRLSEYVRMAASGETVLISDRDRIVAELVPPSPTRAERVHDAVLADAVRNGQLTPAAMSGPPPPTPAVGKLASLLEELTDDRADR
jgi:antitoxin (DNA-binding transcriptional repressor) of toxin-antitoxin stability system